MRKIQKIGFMSLPVITILVGLICFLAGSWGEDRTLKIMGAFWIPLGSLSFLMIMFVMKKKK